MTMSCWDMRTSMGMDVKSRWVSMAKEFVDVFCIIAIDV